MAGALTSGADEAVAAVRSLARRGPQPPPSAGQPRSRPPLLLAAGLILAAVAAGFAAVIAAHPVRPPVAGLDRYWLATVRTWQSGALTDAARVISYVGGPWGG